MFACVVAADVLTEITTATFSRRSDRLGERFSRIKMFEQNGVHAVTARYARLNSRFVLATGAEMNAVHVSDSLHFAEKICLLFERRNDELNTRIYRQSIEARPDLLVQIDKTDDAPIDISGEERAQVAERVETFSLR